MALQLDPGSSVPLFQQIAASIEDAILAGAYPEESRIPSTTEMSTTLLLNPATVLKGVTLLADAGILYKKRGIGMYVSEGATETIKAQRKSLFFESYVKALVAESIKLGLSCEDTLEMIRKGFTHA